MNSNVAGLSQAYHMLFVVALIFLAVMVMLCLIRAIIGPKIADRIVSVNMMGTMIMVIIAILAVMLEEGYLVDICIIYAMISFLAVDCPSDQGVYGRLSGEKTEGGERTWRSLNGSGFWQAPSVCFVALAFFS